MTGTKRVLFVQHQQDCPPGYVGDRLRQHGVELDVVPATDPDLPDPVDYHLIVPLGSDDSAYDESLPYLRQEWNLLEQAIHSDVPVFGICFGAQLLSRVLGGQVKPSPSGPEIGWVRVESTDVTLVEPGPWLAWHLDVMSGPPPGGVELARTVVGTQAFRYGRHLGTQFHPEARPDSAEIWAQHYRDSLEEIGVDRSALLAETHATQREAEQRAHVLTDRVLEHTGALA